MPATTDYWVNDAIGEPLFVVTAEANAGLVKMLPSILNEARSLLGERRLTVAFDRGGWSPKLFAKLVAAGFDLLTYRKGRSPRVPRSWFCEHKGVINGRTITYTLADQGVYQLESDLFRLITPHYKRAEDEGRTLIQSALASAADIVVRERELRVLVAPLSSPHRTRVLATLCRELNATATAFPGTNLILRYDVAEVEKR